MAEKVDVKKILKDLADVNWSENKEEKHKAAQLIIGLINNEEDEMAKEFALRLDKWTTEIYRDLVKESKEDEGNDIMESAEWFASY